MKAKNDAKNRIPTTSLESRWRAIGPVVRRKHGTLIFVCLVKVCHTGSQQSEVERRAVLTQKSWSRDDR